MLIKASSIQNLTDARYFAAQNVNWLGFNIEPNTANFLDPIYMNAMREWVQGPHIVGEFTTTSIEVALEAAHFYGLDALQIGLEALDNYPTPIEIPLFLAVQLGQQYLPTQLPNFFAKSTHADQHFLLIFDQKNDTTQQILQHRDFWRKLCSEFPIIFQFDFQPNLLPKFLDTIEPAGVSILGGSEERVGVKNFDELEEIFEIIQP